MFWKSLVATAGLVIAGVVSLGVFTFLARLLSRPSTIDVVIGVAGMVALICVWIIGVRKVGQKLGLLAISLVLFTGCTKVEPGYVGIVVNQYGDQRGVEDFPLKTGRVFFNPVTQDVYKAPTFLQNIVWTQDRAEGSKDNESITFNSKEGASFNVDVGLSYSLDGDLWPAVFLEFRQPIGQITDVYMRNKVRDSFNSAASTREAMDIVGPGKQGFLQAVKENLESELGTRGFHFDTVTIIGQPRLDSKVQEAINDALKATQDAIRSENLVRQKEAEAEQKIAEARGIAESVLIEARAQAEANQLLSESISPTLVEWETVKKWEGALPQVTGGAIPLLRLDGN